MRSVNTRQNRSRVSLRFFLMISIQVTVSALLLNGLLVASPRNQAFGQTIQSGARVGFIPLDKYLQDLVLPVSAMNSADGVLWVAGRFGSLIAIDSRTLEVLDNFELEYDYAGDLAVDSARGHVWVATSIGVIKFDPKSRETATRYASSSFAEAIALSPDNRFLWIADSRKGIGRLDTVNGEFSMAIPHQDEPGVMALLEDMTISPDGRTLFTLTIDLASEFGKAPRWVSAFDTDTLKETARVAINREEGNVYGGRLALTPDGKRLFVQAATDSRYRLLSVDVSKMTISGTIAETGGGDISVSPDGRQLWFGSGGNRLRSADIDSGRVNEWIAGGGSCLSFTPNGEKLFTCNAGRGGVDVIKTFSSPGPPQRARVTPNLEGLTVSWIPPVRTGGLPVTGYTAIATPGGASCQSRKLSCQISGLEPGVTYSVSVSATNRYGSGPRVQSVESKRFMTLVGPPRQVKAILSGGKAKVTWEAPRSSGSRRILGYTVTASPSGRTCHSSRARSCEFTRLPVGIDYQFTVQARTSEGLGQPGVSRSLRIAAPAPAPLPPRKPVQILS